MAELQGRKVFKVFNQDFIVNENYNVTKELGQGAYGIVWYVCSKLLSLEPHGLTTSLSQCRDQHSDWRGRGRQESHQCVQ